MFNLNPMSNLLLRHVYLIDAAGTYWFYIIQVEYTWIVRIHLDVFYSFGFQVCGGATHDAIWDLIGASSQRTSGTYLYRSSLYAIFMYQLLTRLFSRAGSICTCTRQVLYTTYSIAVLEHWYSLSTWFSILGLDAPLQLPAAAILVCNKGTRWYVLPFPNNYRALIYSLLRISF